MAIELKQRQDTDGNILDKARNGNPGVRVYGMEWKDGRVVDQNNEKVQTAIESGVDIQIIVQDLTLSEQEKIDALWDTYNTYYWDKRNENGIDANAFEKIMSDYVVGDPSKGKIQDGSEADVKVDGYNVWGNSLWAQYYADRGVITGGGDNPGTDLESDFPYPADTRYFDIVQAAYTV